MTDTAESDQVFRANQAKGHANQHNGNVNGNVYYSKTVEPAAGRSKKKGFFSLNKLLNEKRNSVEVIEAAKDGKLNRVEHLLEHTYVDIKHTIDRPGAKGLSALHEAAFHGHLDVARLILQPWAGADAGLQVDVNCYTPLMSAAVKGQDQMITLLLQNGASLDARMLRQSSYYENALTIAIARGHYSTAELLLNHGANPNAQLGKPGGHSRVPMHTAIFSGPTYVELLLDRGARKDTEFSGAELSLKTNHWINDETFTLYDAAIVCGWQREFIDKLAARGIPKSSQDSPDGPCEHGPTPSRNLFHWFAGPVPTTDMSTDTTSWVSNPSISAGFTHPWSAQP